MLLPRHRPADRTDVLNQLGAPLVLVQLGMLDLCVVRAAMDVLHGSLGVEGKIALAGALLLTALLGLEAVLSRRSFDTARGNAGTQRAATRA